MAYDKTYTVTESRLNRSYLFGFKREGNGAVSIPRQEKDGSRVLIFPVFNSFETGSAWGRFHLDAELQEGCVLILRAFAKDTSAMEEEAGVRELEAYFRDEQISPEEKIRVFDQANGSKRIGHTDMLLYDRKGRYLWICIEITGRGAGRLSHMALEKTGDHFMWTFPEIYREQGSFFHRYLSIFSTMYDSVGSGREAFDRCLSVDRAPSWMLPHFAQWLGFPWEGEYLEEGTARRFIKELYRLNRIKGTKRTVERLIEIVLEKPAVIVERNHLEKADAKEDADLYDRLYGRSIWDVTILIFAKAKEQQRAQLDFLIRQFGPVRSRVTLVFCQESSRLDSYCYLDKNAVLTKTGRGVLDAGETADFCVLSA